MIADVAAEDQRIAEIARIEIDRAVDRRNAHAVAVIADAGDHALRHRRGCSTPGGSDSSGVSGGAKQNTSVLQTGLRAEPRAQRIADHAAEARVRAAVGLEGRRMIVRFDLEADAVACRRTGRRPRCP